MGSLDCRRYDRKVLKLIALSLVLFSTQSFAEQQPYYPPQQALEKGTLYVPLEFQEGVASEEQVFAWAESLIMHLYVFQADQLDILREDYDGDGRIEIAIGNPVTYGSGGRVFLYFDSTDSGYRYLGQVPNLDTRYFHCYSRAEDCYFIHHGGVWGETTFVLYKMGPLEARMVDLFYIVHEGDRDSYTHLLEFPETEKLLLDRFASRSRLSELENGQGPTN